MKQSAAFYLKEFNTFYGKQETEILEVFGGTAGYTYLIGDYFLKVYDKDLQMTASCLKTLRYQLSVLSYLQNATVMRDRICYPIAAADGAMTAETDAFSYVVYNRIPGEAIGWERRFTDGEAKQLISLLTDLHTVDIAPISQICPKEDFHPHWLEDFPVVLRKSLTDAPEEFQKMSREYGTAANEKLKELISLAGQLKSDQLPYVLCHTDAHGGNLMSDGQGKVTLIDWENMILAPKEADLFMYRELPFYRDFPESSAANPKAMRYYVLRRDLEDIWDFYRSILYEENPVMPREEIYTNTLRIIRHLAAY